MKHIHKIIIILLSSILFGQNLLNEAGIPIRQGIHIEWFKTVSPGTDGTAIFVWSDNRFGPRNIFAQKVNGDGELLWGEAGAVVTDLPGRQEDPVSISDGNGGVFIAWIDYRFDEEGDVFYQHIDSDGYRLLDDNGIPLALIPSKQISINMCTDSLGGVFVTWQDKRNQVDEDIYGTHISSDHLVVEPGLGVPVIVAGGAQMAKSIEYAGNNEAFIVWADARNGGNMDIYGQRLDMNMSPLMTSDGFPVASSDMLETRPRTTYMSNNQSFVTWKSGDESSEILYQIIDPNGFVLMAPVKVSQFDAIQKSPRIKRNANGEVFISWTDLRFDSIDGDIFFQKIGLDGTILWGDGVQLDTSDEKNLNGRFAGDQNGGLYVVWERGSFPDTDIPAQYFSPDGVAEWTNDQHISNANGNQDAPNVVYSADIGLFTIYGDKSSGSVDLRVDYPLDGSSPFSENDILGATGMDGDVKYIKGFNANAGESILLWEDNRYSQKIYADRAINEDLEHTNGVQITYSDDSASDDDLTYPRYHFDGNHLYVATFDGSGTPKSMRINKLTTDFENVWGDSGVVATSSMDQWNGQLIGLDGTIGCFWSQYQSISMDAFFQRFDDNGTPLLDGNGKVLLDGWNDEFLLKAFNTPDNKIMIFWLDNAWHNATLKVKKIDLNGNLAVGWPSDGYNLSAGVYEIHDFSANIVSNDDGIFTAWRQTTSTETEIYGQMVDWDGNMVWGDAGISISNAEQDQVNPSMDIDPIGKTAFVAWEDLRNGNDYNIYGQEIDLITGELSGEAVQFSSDTTQQLKPYVKNVYENHYFILWEDGRGFNTIDPLLTGGTDIYGAGYRTTIGMTSEIDGFSVVKNYHDQKDIQVTSYNQESQYLLHWIDLRSSGKEDIYNYYGRIVEVADLLNVKDDHEVWAQDFSLHSAYPNPFNGAVQFSFNMKGTNPVEFAIFDLTGRKVSDRLILPNASGTYQISWNGTDMRGVDLSSGIYFYQFKANNVIIKDKITYLK
ncbi:MAG: T9SS type A sorting domain-containing protein [Candidatus Marinimicrobia bacterium]|nr:T9SS type A sorting domain-containing protein [Candidatus Neomarinimicrobiota bacterium]MBT4382862.1 T9SS type A sorting domain-containing protein [Candidatus Neomarinimicrobiota bacterium]MBT5068627.1 T9SS type A sorting domain-containing protein [Candidatus Neomarinimicrobiota bacterium]MBT6940163.1 T9SS type A sorting domain-containing protein [Candidatus Neomarinimicrobiota bacterium]